MRGLRVMAVVALAACSQRDSVRPPEADRLSVGTWGGTDAGIRAESGTAHVHIGCTFGNFPMPILFDANSRFTVNGSYVVRAYPIQVGPELPAQMSGVLDGNRLTFSVAVNDTVEKRVVSLGPVTVLYGREPSMQNCPICVKPSAL